MQSDVLQWLDKTALNMPDKLALYDSQTQVTYGNFRKKSITLANKIIEIENMLGNKEKQPIVVFMEKSVKVVISFLGIAYSGNFYSFIDTEMPEYRVDRILEVLCPQIVITSKKLKRNFEKFNFSGEYIFYDEEIYDPIFEKVVKEKTEKIIDTDLLYIYFTSGSTGIPKGVAGTHRNIINYVEWFTETFNIVSEDRFGNQFPLFYAASALDIYSCIKTGATLYFIDKGLFTQPVKLLEFIKEYKISTIQWVPSALTIISKLKAFRNVDVSSSLKRVVFIGEIMSNRQLNIWRKYLPSVMYIHMYGSTETWISLYYIVEREFEDDAPLPLGKPIRNVEILVLDEDNSPVQKGKSGELCIRGAGLMSGYYNNQEKTKEVLVQNPLNKMTSDIIYRTGDFVKYNELGEVIYLSRKDSQIKYAGHRIELGEIETAVYSIDEVSLCCCLYDDIKQCIVLFIDAPLDKKYVCNCIEKRLPVHMIPGKVIVLEEMPVNANGKIDRVKLKEILLSNEEK